MMQKSFLRTTGLYRILPVFSRRFIILYNPVFHYIGPFPGTKISQNLSKGLEDKVKYHNRDVNLR